LRQQDHGSVRRAVPGRGIFAGDVLELKCHGDVPSDRRDDASEGPLTAFCQQPSPR
jgi:hypothetical protein